MFLSGAVGAAVIKLIDNVIMWHLNRKAKKEDNKSEDVQRLEKELRDIKEGLQIVLLDRIQYVGLSYLKAGEIRLEDRRILHKMHKAYHNTLGGNGDLDALMAEIDELPLK